MPYNNQVTDVGIVYQSFNQRGIVTHRAHTRALVRQSNGVLWAAVRENTTQKFINIYRSSDNGFSWQRMYSGNFTLPDQRKVGLAGLNANGPFMALLVYEKYDRLIFINSYFDNANLVYNTEWWVFQMSTMTRLDPDTDTTIPASNVVATNSDEMAFYAPYNENAIFLVYVSSAKLTIKVYHPTYQRAAESSTTSGETNLFNVMDAVVDEEGTLHVAILQNGDLNYRLMHYRFTQKGAVLHPPGIITTFDGKPVVMNVNIARDGSGALMVQWGQQALDSSDVDIYLSVATDGGETWSTPTVIPKTIGHSAYVDPATGQLDTRNTLMGGEEGFIIGYTRKAANSVGRSFVRLITKDELGAYNVQEEKEIGTAVAEADDPVPGLRFFHPVSSKLQSLDEPSYVRIAYQIGEGDSTTQTDTKPVRFGQEQLLQSAYPALLPSEQSGYDLDIADSQSLLVRVNIIGAPNANSDYYALGYTGSITTRYRNAFLRSANDVRLLQFEPRLTSHTNDRTAYEAPVEYAVKAFFEPLTYDDPTTVTAALEPYQAVIERDVRKVFLQPDFHLSRTFLLNKGNYFKRTVWLMNYDGVDYEITQVVPFIVRDQIAYYQANAYVVGPVRDPFARSILPSET